MDQYIVSARKYRPSTFASVIGQKPLSAALKHAIATDRLAHAYLFCGSRGVGKTSCARIFAKTINCTHRTPDGEACNECESCQAFNAGSSMNIIELDAASHNGVDDMRALIEQVMMPPTQGRFRVFIIDEVHMLTSQAFNAFLKTLEEPPAHAIFVLATTEKHKIIPTILSRCQIYDFNRISIQDMVDHMKYVAQQEGIAAEPAALNVIARKADGAMRDALSIFDQVAASSLGNITYQSTIDNLNMLDAAYYSRLIEAFIAGNVPAALLIYKEVRDKGFDSQFFINGLGLYIRDLMLAKQPTTMGLLEMADDQKQDMAQVAAKCDTNFIYKAMDLCNEADYRYRDAANKQFLIELTLIKLCQLCSPSPGIDDGGEGQLKPIVVAEDAAPYTAQAPQATAAAPAAAPASAPAAPAAVALATPLAKPQAPAAAPVAQEAPIPSVSPKPQKSDSKPKISLSIKGISPKKEEAAQMAQAPASHRDSSYTPEQLYKAWISYAEAHPTERILSNTMIAATPHLIDEHRYFIAVEDSIQVEVINESKHQLLQYLRDTLSNDNIDFEVRVSQHEASPVTWTSREVLQYMLDERPVLLDYIKEFGFTLA